MDILSVIQSTYPSMTKAEKKVADYILSENDGHFFLHVTLNRLAAVTGVGQASVIRMINACGYDSYRAFMAELSQAKYRASAISKSDLRKQGNTLADEWNTQLQLCCANLDQDMVRLAAQTICRADLVVCTGYGNSAHIAALTASHLRRVNLVAMQQIPGEIAYFTDKAAAPKRIVVLAFSMRGETVDILTQIKNYVEEGSCVMSFTSRPESTLGKLSNFVFYTPSKVADKQSGRWFDGIFNQLFVVEALVEEIYKLKFLNEPEE